jgi:hypothetical protein
MENPFLPDEQLVANIRAKTTRQVLAEFIAVLGQLLIHLDVQAEITDLSVNFHGHLLRIDIAQLTDDGQHIAAWLCALDANPMSASFATRLDLPAKTASPTTTH